MGLRKRRIVVLPRYASARTLVRSVPACLKPAQKTCTVRYQVQAAAPFIAPSATSIALSMNLNNPTGRRMTLSIRWSAASPFMCIRSAHSSELRMFDTCCTLHCTFQVYLGHAHACCMTCVYIPVFAYIWHMAQRLQKKTPKTHKN